LPKFSQNATYFPKTHPMVSGVHFREIEVYGGHSSRYVNWRRG